MLTTFVGALAVVFGLSRAWPQVRKIVVNGDASGVSSATWTLTLCGFVTWEIIGIIEGIPAVIVYNFLASISAVAVLVAMVRQQRARFLRITLAVVATVALNVLVATLVGNVGISVVGVIFSVTMFIPQAIKVFREPTNGVSALTWWLASATSVAWMSYGVMLGELVLIAPNLVMLPAALVIATRIRTTDRRDAIDLLGSIDSVADAVNR